MTSFHLAVYKSDDVIGQKLRHYNSVHTLQFSTAHSTIVLLPFVAKWISDLLGVYLNPIKDPVCYYLDTYLSVLLQQYYSINTVCRQ